MPCAGRWPTFCYPASLLLYNSCQVASRLVLRMKCPRDAKTGVKSLLIRPVKATTRRSQDPLGIFLGLLSMGDRRVLSEISRLRSQLARKEVKEICAAELGYLHGPIVEFLLDWMEELPTDSGPFGAIAGILFRLPREHSDRGVIELERIFPAQIGQKSTVQRGEWSVPEFGELIAAKLRLLSDAEEEPKVTPKIMQAWGIEG